MRSCYFKLVGVLLLSGLFQVTTQAQEWNGNNFQSVEEQQRIREMRLLEWHAQQQGAEQEHAYFNGQDNAQNVSLDQPYQQAPAIVSPEREDLFNAANGGNIQQMQKLLAQGLNVNVANNEGETALHMSAARGHFEAVLFLINNGAKVNARTVKNWIPLHHAVRFRHANIVNFLVQRGASAYARTSDGLSAVDMAKNNQDYRILSIMGAR